jgi:hypothetical protein
MTRGPECLSDLVLDEKLAGGAVTVAQVAHLDGCENCRARLAELERDREAFQKRARPAAFADAVLAQRPPRRRWAIWVAIAPAALGAMAVVAMWMRPRPLDGERVKGAPVAVELWVRSGDKTERYAEDHHYKGGDALQLIYSARAPSHLTVIDVEQGGKAALLYRSDGALPAANRRRIDQSWVLDAGTNPERLYLVFTDGAPDENSLLDAAKRADVARPDPLAVPATAQATFLIAR